MMSARAAIFCVLAGLALASPATALPGRDTLNAVKDAATSTFGKFNAEITTGTRSFVVESSIHDRYVIEAARIARQRASSRVLIFAARLAADARTSAGELQQVLHNYNVDARPASGLDFRRRGMISELNDTPAFDRRYLAQQILANSEQRILLRRYIGSGKITAIKQFAAWRLRKIDEQLSTLQRLRREF